MSRYSGKLEDISLRIPQWWAPSHPSRYKQTADHWRRNEIEDLQNRKQATSASSASSVVTGSFDVVCERNDVAGNFEGTLDWNATFVKSLFQLIPAVWDAAIHAFHFGNCRQPEVRKCKLRFYRTTCGAVGVRRGMPTCRGEKCWPSLGPHGCNL